MLAGDGIWALERFGTLGKQLPGMIREALADCHEEHANAQMQINSTNQRAYGAVSYTVQERLHTVLAGQSGVEFKRPGKGKPKILVVNGTMLVPWRYSGSATANLLERRYAKSDSRIATFSTPLGNVQGMLDLGDENYEPPTPEELELLESLQALGESEAQEFHRVVVIAYASNPRALHKVVWADASLNDDGTLNMDNIQVLFNAEVAETNGASEPKRFDTQPRRGFNLKSKQSNG